MSPLMLLAIAGVSLWLLWPSSAPSPGTPKSRGTGGASSGLTGTLYLTLAAGTPVFDPPMAIDIVRNALQYPAPPLVPIQNFQILGAQVPDNGWGLTVVTVVVPIGEQQTDEAILRGNSLFDSVVAS